MGERPPALFAETPKQARRFMDELYKEAYLQGKVTAVDTEFVPVTHEPVLMSYSWGRGVRRVVRAEMVKEHFGDWLVDPETKLAYQNYKEDVETMGALGLPEAELIHSFYVDVMVVGVLRDETLVKHGLKAQMHHFLKWYRREYGQTFAYVPSGKKKAIVMNPRQVMDDLPPDALTGAVLKWGGSKGTHGTGERSPDEWRQAMVDYAGDDAEGTQILAMDHRRDLKETGYWDKYAAVDRPFTITLMQCEQSGVLVDQPILRKILRKQDIRIMRAERCFRAAAGNPKLNLRSGPQMKKLLFDEWGWPEHPTVETDSGGLSMDKEVLGWWLEKHKLQMAEVKLAFNNATTMKGTFLEGILSGVDDDGRLRSDLNQIGAKTSGRISSRKFDKLIERNKTLKSGEVKFWIEKKKVGANLQNIPARKEKDPDGIRGAFRAPQIGEVTAWGDKATEKHKLLVADYSGFHLVLVIHFVSKLTRKSAMLEIMKKYKTPSAVHVYTCIQMFKHAKPHRCDPSTCKDKKTGQWKKHHGENKSFSLKEFTMDDWQLVKPLFPDQYTYSKNCVTGETMILTDHGYKRIDDLCAGAPLGRSKPSSPIRIVTRDGIREVADVYRGGAQPVKKVTTELGFAVRANDSHDMPVVRGGKIEMVKVADMVVGDVCVLKFGSNVHGQATCLPPMEQGGATSYKPIELPDELTPEVARLLGYYVSEGYSVKSNTTYYTSFGFGLDDDDMVLDVERCLRYVVGSRLRTVEEGVVRRLYVTSKDLYEWWRFLGCGTSSADKQIPPSVLGAPWDVKREFLRAYFAGDGSVSKGVVKATSKSELLIRQLQGELINVGVACSVFSHEVPGYGVFWSVQVSSGRYVRRFAKYIGFACSRKQKLADEVGDSADHSTLRLEGFEHEHAMIRDRVVGELRQRVGQCIRGVCRMGENIVRRLDLDEMLSGTEMEKMLDDGLWTVRVTSIEPDGEAEVFDLYEPVHKMMVASGLLVGDTNFALIFLGSAWTLAYNTGRDANDEAQLNECKQHYDDWYELYPEIKTYQNHFIDHGYEHGWVPTLGGRRGHVKKMLEGCDRDGRYIQDDEKRKKMIKHGERVCTNTPAQGCLDYDTRILTQEHGLVPIGTLVSQEARFPKIVTVWEGSRWARAGVMPSGMKRELIVRFHGGLEVRCSPDHRFWTNNHSGERGGWTSSWKTPGEFKKQQFVVLSDPASWSAPVRWEEAPSRGNGARDLSINSLSGFDQGLFLGRVASDGSVSLRDVGGCVQLHVAEHEKAILPKLRELCTKLGRFIEHTIDRTKDYRLPMHRLDVNSTSLARQIAEAKWKVPHEVWKDSDVLRGYLCGMFDGDGTVNEDGVRLCFGSGHKHEAWARDIQQALFMLGIRSRLKLSGETRIDVCVQKADSRRFADLVGFLNPVKQEKLLRVDPHHNYDPACGRVLRVAEIVDTGRNVQMYDVVDSETHRFAAAGLVTHNSEADIVKMAFNLIRESKKLIELRVAPLFPVHDEAVCEGPERTSVEGLDEQIRLMKEPYKDEMGVELAVEGGIGDNWISAKP